LGIVTDDASHFEKVWEEIEVSFHECPSCYSAVPNKLFISSSFPVHVTFPNHILGHVHLYRVNNDDTDDDFVQVLNSEFKLDSKLLKDTFAKACEVVPNGKTKVFNFESTRAGYTITSSTCAWQAFCTCVHRYGNYLSCVFFQANPTNLLES